MAKGYAYREKRYQCGEYVDVYVYPVWPKEEKGQRRGRKKAPSSAAQKALNERHAQARLSRLMNANFTNRDISLGLDYALPMTDQVQAKKDIQNYLRRVKRMYKKAGIEFRYIWVMEKTKAGRIHFHMVVGGGYDENGAERITRDDLEACWRKTKGAGRANADRLQAGRGGYAALANYFTKTHKTKKGGESERCTYCAYNCSKNLVDPEPQTSDSRIRSKKAARALADHDLNVWPKYYDGYTVEDMDAYFYDGSGHVYMFARLHRDSCEFITKHGRKRKRGDPRW